MTKPRDMTKRPVVDPRRRPVAGGAASVAVLPARPRKHEARVATALRKTVGGGS